MSDLETRTTSAPFRVPRTDGEGVIVISGVTPEMKTNRALLLDMRAKAEEFGKDIITYGEYSQATQPSSLSGDPVTRRSSVINSRMAEEAGLPGAEQAMLANQEAPAAPQQPTGFSPMRAMGGVIRETAPYALGTAGGAGLAAASGVDPRAGAAAGFVGTGLMGQSSEMILPMINDAIKKGDLNLAQNMWNDLATKMGMNTESAGYRGAQAIAEGATVPGMIKGGPVASVAREFSGATDKVQETITGAIQKALGEQDFKTVRELSDFLADKANIPEPQTKGEQIITDASRGLMEAASGQQLGKVLQGRGLSQTTLGNRVGELLADKPLQQLLGGVGAETGASTAEAMGAPAPVQLAAGIVGDIAGSALGGGANRLGKMANAASADLPDVFKKAFPGLTPADIPEATRMQIAQGENFGIPVLSSDLLRRNSPNPGRKELNLRITQENARAAEINDLLIDFGVDPKNIDVEIAPLVDDFYNVRADELAQWTGDKQDVIQRLSPQGEVDTSKTVAALQEEIARLGELGTNEVNPLMNKMADWEQALQGKNLQQVESLRKLFGNSFVDPSFANVKTESEQVVNTLYRTLREDMGDHIKNVGSEADYNQWMVSNKNLSSMSDDFGSEALKTLINNSASTAAGKPASGSSVAAINSFMDKADPKQMNLLYERLSPEGQTRMQTVLMAKMAEDSTDLGRLSTNDFARKLKEYEKINGIVFSEDAVNRMVGLRKALEITHNAPALSGAVPSVGQIPGSELPGGRTVANRAIRANPLLGMAVAEGANLTSDQMAAVFESPRSRDYLIRLANIPDNQLDTPMATNLVKRMMEVARASQTTGNIPGLEEEKAISEAEAQQKAIENEALRERTGENYVGR